MSVCMGVVFLHLPTCGINRVVAFGVNGVEHRLSHRVAEAEEPASGDVGGISASVLKRAAYDGIIERKCLDG
jgi:hypothetical protein